MKIAYYVSGHGLGHAARAAQVMAALPKDVEIVVKTQAPPEFLRRESGREDLKILSEAWDVGVVQTHNRAIDWRATDVAATGFLNAIQSRIAAEGRWLRAQRIDRVVCDICPAPLLAARQAGTRSIAIANFTWADIYSPVAHGYKSLRALSDLSDVAYDEADAILVPGMDTPKMLRNLSARPIPLIGRRGVDISPALRARLGLAPDTRLVLVYLGAWGETADALFSRARQLTNVALLSFHPLPQPVHVLQDGEWNYPDVLASVGAVVAKPGYGTVAEAMANGISVVYHPRDEFAEYPALRAAIETWGGGVCVPLADFEQGAWLEALEAALALKPAALDHTGADAAAAEILGYEPALCI